MTSAVSSFYQTFRYLALIGFIVAIACIAVKMIISSIGKQKQQYKDALKNWLIGLILFVIFLFNVTRKCCSSLVVNRSDAFLNSATKASLAGACALLVSGVFDYTWYNYRVFFMFWALLGFACAAANLNNKNGSELYLGAEEERLASITIPIRKRNKKSDLSDIEKEVMDNDRRE
jgi:hypothetical protein